MTNEQRALLELISVAMGNPCQMPLSGCNWDEVVRLSYEQGVPAIACDGLASLYASHPKLHDNGSPQRKDLSYRWIGQVISSERHYAKYEKAIRQLSAFCKDLEIRILLLKGYGCSLNYPIPSHRPCGDIDIYLFGKQTILDEQIRDLNGEIDCHNEHHSIFCFEGFVVENHKTILDVNTHKSNAHLEKVLEQLAEESEESQGIPNLFLPSAKFNSIHLLRHMANDFAAANISLRHILDWGTFVNKSDFDWEFVRKVVTSAKMDKFLYAVNDICVDWFGFPREKFPVSSHNPHLRDKILEEIFRHKKIPYTNLRELALWNKILYGMSKSYGMWKNRWKYKIVFDESLWESFLWKTRNRIRI